MSVLRADAVLFDKDGTLFDFEATWGAWLGVMIERWAGGDPALAGRLADAVAFDRTAQAFGPGSVAIAGTPAEIAMAIAPVMGAAPDELAARLNAEAAAAPMVEAVPLAPLLEGLAAAGLQLGVATNDAEAPARAHLAAAGIDGHFDFIVGSDSGYGAKPTPGMLVAFADRTALDPRRIVMVGDSLHDLHAGRAAGMQTVAVLTGLAPPEVLAPVADAVLPDIGHLPGWLAGKV